MTGQHAGKQHDSQQAQRSSPRRAKSDSKGSQGEALRRLQHVLGNKQLGELLIQRQMTTGEPDDAAQRLSPEEEEWVQSKAEADAVPSVTPELEARITASQGRGQALDSGVRSFFERRFGLDLGGVRIHAGHEANRMSRELRARAFTQGQDIFFRSGQYDPASEKGKRLLAHELAHVVQQSGGREHIARQDDEDELTIGESIAEAFMSSPPLVASEADRYVEEIGELLSGMEPGDLFFERIYNVYWGFAALSFDLKQVPEGQTTTEEQRQRANDLAGDWSDIQDDIAAHNRREARADLERARTAAQQLRTNLLYAYRDIYMAGQDPEDVEVGSGSMKTLAEKTKDLLVAINDADANVTGRSVQPLIPVLDKILSVTNLITGWKVTSGLAAESQSDLAALQNAWSLSTTALGLAGFGKFLPLFSHIGPLLDQIATQWGVVVGQLREENRLWWQAREVMGEDLPHPDAMPGGEAVFNYMKRVFRASGPLSERPSDAVVEFFDNNREMFDKVAVEVMDRSWAEVPTESSWIFWTEVDPDELNRWVYYNREMVWRLIYGRGMDMPQ